MHTNLLVAQRGPSRRHGQLPRCRMVCRLELLKQSVLLLEVLAFALRVLWRDAVAGDASLGLEIAPSDRQLARRQSQCAVSSLAGQNGKVSCC